MKFLWKKKENKTKEPIEEPIEEPIKEGIKGKTSLEIFCIKHGDVDGEIYNALSEIMLLYPWRLKRMLPVSIEETIRQAEKKIQDPFKERESCKLATQLAIYIRDMKAVKRLGEKYSKLTGERLKILDVLEQAMEMSQGYYREQHTIDESTT